MAFGLHTQYLHMLRRRWLADGGLTREDSIIRSTWYLSICINSSAVSGIACLVKPAPRIDVSGPSVMAGCREHQTSRPCVGHPPKMLDQASAARLWP